jgi:hypothetical protein
MALKQLKQLGRAMAQAVSRRPPTAEAPGQSMWNLWWTQWHWDRFFLEYFSFPLSISFHRCSITRKNEKKGLHNKPQGRGASVTSAAGPLSQKKKRQLHT